MPRLATSTLVVLLATSGCSSDVEPEGTGGAGSSGTSTSAGSAPTSNGSSAQGAGGDTSVGAGGDPAGAGGDTTSAGGAPGVGGGPSHCGDEVCSDDERCQQCDSDDREEPPYFQCWPDVAPDGAFLCGNRTCALFGEYCQEEQIGIDSCGEWSCPGIDPECASDDACDCVVDPCSGSDVELESCEVDDNGQVHVLCSPF